VLRHSPILTCARCLLLLAVLLGAAACASHPSAPQYGFSHPQPKSEDNAFFLGSFLGNGD
jgi:hypothetical protein